MDGLFRFSPTTRGMFGPPNQYVQEEAHELPQTSPQTSSTSEAEEETTSDDAEFPENKQNVSSSVPANIPRSTAFCIYPENLGSVKKALQPKNPTRVISTAEAEQIRYEHQRVNAKAATHVNAAREYREELANRRKIAHFCTV